MMMNRREFVSATLAGSALSGANEAVPDQTARQTAPGDVNQGGDLVIERPARDKPHTGKVLAVIEPHSDDAPIFAAGTIAKLLNEGYTGYLIRTSNDEKDSFDLSMGETVLANERETQAMAKELGLKQVFNLNYRNHRMDDVSRVEMRARLLFLFRLLKVDTIFSYDPWGHYEENPDHYVTAQCVESACWMAGGRLDYPEHFAAGLTPHGVKEKYYFARGPQLVNRVVDISSTIDKKMSVIRANRTMIKNMVGQLKQSLAARNLRLPALERDDDAAVREYVNLRFRERDRQLGRKYGLEYAEAYHYIGPDNQLEDYLAKNAVPLR
jgi:LmbE family N-acetylglucosaminyl deacetylase